MNHGKTRDPRFWERWKRNGATERRIDSCNIELLETAWDQDRDPIGIWTPLQRALSHLNFPNTNIQTTVTENGSLRVRSITSKSFTKVFVAAPEVWKIRVPVVHPRNKENAQSSAETYFY